jgi:hypothetical protein
VRASRRDPAPRMFGTGSGSPAATIAHLRSDSIGDSEPGRTSAATRRAARIPRDEPISVTAWRSSSVVRIPRCTMASPMASCQPGPTSRPTSTKVWTGVVTATPSRSIDPSRRRRCATSSARRTCRPEQTWARGGGLGTGSPTRTQAVVHEAATSGTTTRVAASSRRSRSRSEIGPSGTSSWTPFRTARTRWPERTSPLTPSRRAPAVVNGSVTRALGRSIDRMRRRCTPPAHDVRHCRRPVDTITMNPAVDISDRRTNCATTRHSEAIR